MLPPPPFPPLQQADGFCSSGAAQSSTMSISVLTTKDILKNRPFLLPSMRQHFQQQPPGWLQSHTSVKRNKRWVCWDEKLLWWPKQWWIQTWGSVLLPLLKGYRPPVHQQILKKNNYCIICLTCQVIATQSFAAFRNNYHCTLIIMDKQHCYQVQCFCGYFKPNLRTYKQL